MRAPVLLCCRRHLPAPFFCRSPWRLLCALATAGALLVRAANAQLALASHRLDLRDLLAQLAKLLHSVVLPHRHLKAKPEQLLGGRLLLVHQLVVAQTTNLFEFHLFSPALNPFPAGTGGASFSDLPCPTSPPPRSSQRPAAARTSSSTAACSTPAASPPARSPGHTPSISKRILPGRTTATQ